MKYVALLFGFVAVVHESIFVTAICTDDLVSTFRTSITASSQMSPNDKSNNYGPDRAILNVHQSKDANGVDQMGAWVAEKNNFNQWIQIELKDPALIKGIVTQGRDGCCQQWVKKFRVLYSEDCHKWHTLGGFNVTDAFFAGNTDEKTPALNMFHCPTVAKCIRINPLGWNNNIAMRVGLLGCTLNLNGPPTTTVAPPTTTAAPIVTTTTTQAPPPTTTSTTTTTTTTTPKPKQTTAKPKQTTAKPTQTPKPTAAPTQAPTQPPPAITNKVTSKLLPPVFLPILPVSGGTGTGTSGGSGSQTGNGGSGTQTGNGSGNGSGSGTGSGLSPGKPGSCIKSCQGLANGDYQACAGCDMYVTCVWESMFSDRACPGGLFWDDSEKRCVLKSSTCP